MPLPGKEGQEQLVTELERLADAIEEKRHTKLDKLHRLIEEYHLSLQEEPSKRKEGTK